MDTNQIFSIVNACAQQAYGTNAVAVVDASSLVSLGNTVLSSSDNTEAFLNTLVQRIGRTIVRYRAYSNKLNDMILGDMEYGMILQKLNPSVGDAEADQMYSLEDGKSIDHYIVKKPTVNQKLFVERNPYQFHITIQLKTLKEAFLSEQAMSTFVAAVFGKVRNKLEMSAENLARVCLATGAVETKAEQQIKLLTEYNATAATGLTAQTALIDDAFLRFAIGRIKDVIVGMGEMSTLYNDGSVETFTPSEYMRVKVLAKFEHALETSVQYAAFHDQYVKIPHAYKTLAFWQGAQTPDKIMIKRPSDKADTTLNNVMAIIHDKDALGLYQLDETVLTTPINAAGAYYNTYYHNLRNYLVDTSENIVVFTLA